MKFRTILSSSIAAAMMLCPRPVFAAEAEIRRIGADEALSLCPSVGRTGLVLGEPSSRQNRELVEKPDQLPPQYAPFTAADFEFTPWSGRLAGVTYLAASPDGAANALWGKQLEDSLRKAGWTDSAHSDLTTAMALDPRLLEKAFDTHEGPRTILLEFDVSGALMLRCGDAKLLEISRNERDGRLETGSPRPAPLPTGPAVPLPTEADCSNPEVLAAFKIPGRVDENVPALRRITEGGFRIADQKRHEERLHSWLSWKLRTSGRVSQDRIWEVEEAAVPPADAKSDAIGLVNMLNAVGEGSREESSPEAFCRSIIGLMIDMAESDKRDIDRLAKLNRALEAEAQRQGVDID